MELALQGCDAGYLGRGLENALAEQQFEGRFNGANVVIETTSKL